MTHGYDSPHWMVIYQSGGLIQDIATCLPDLGIVEIDYDEIAEGGDPLEYFSEKLSEIREKMVPGKDRKNARLWLRDALERRGLR